MRATMGITCGMERIHGPALSEANAALRRGSGMRCASDKLGVGEGPPPPTSLCWGISAPATTCQATAKIPRHDAAHCIRGVVPRDDGDALHGRSGMTARLMPLVLLRQG